MIIETIDQNPIYIYINLYIAEKSKKNVRFDYSNHYAAIFC